MRHSVSEPKANASAAFERFLTIGLLILSLVIIFSGCDKKSTDPTSDQNLNTPCYFEDAISYDESLNRWLFLNWLGIDSNGGAVLVFRVHDKASEVPSNFDAKAADKALDYARDAWVSSLRDVGIKVRTITCNTSNCQLGTLTGPKIDVWYVSELPNNYAGLCTHSIDWSSKKFYDCKVEIETGRGADEYLRVTVHEFGHALGIIGADQEAGHSHNKNDVMFHSASYWTLTNGDKATIRRIYQSSPYFRPATGESLNLKKPGELVIWQQHTSKSNEPTSRSSSHDSVETSQSGQNPSDIDCVCF